MSTSWHKILYLSPDSLTGGLGQSQIWPYVHQLARYGFRIMLVTWEPEIRDQTSWRAVAEAQMLGRADEVGIRWVRLRHRMTDGSICTIWDSFRTMLFVFWLVVRGRVRLIHARSDIAMAIAWIVRGLTGCKTLYDTRGFWADERLDGGLWREGRLYRMVRRWEDRWVQQADGVVVLTDAAAHILQEQFPRVSISVIPTAVDLKRFIMLSSKRQFAKGWTVVYSGSLGTWQGLDDVAAFFLAVCRRLSESRLVILTPEPVQCWYPRLLEHGLNGSQLIVEIDPAPNTVVQRIASADVGLAFYRRSRSAAGCSPVKVGEYLACGVPVAVSAGIGDCDELLAQWRTGVTISDDVWDKAVDALDTLRRDPALPARCRALAETHFSVDRASQQYLRLYERLTGEAHETSSEIPEELHVAAESSRVASEYDKAIT